VLRKIREALEIDVVGKHGMFTNLREGDPFQWATPFPKFTYANGMSVTEWDRRIRKFENDY
jgi:hypothetical protein